MSGSGIFENLAVKNEVHDKSILRILCGTFDERTVQKNGVQYQGRFYYHTDLIAHQGEKVIINYDPSNMDELNVLMKTCVRSARQPQR